jgi:hypothetical protein
MNLDPLCLIERFIPDVIDEELIERKENYPIFLSSLCLNFRVYL